MLHIQQISLTEIGLGSFTGFDKSRPDGLVRLVGNKALFKRPWTAIYCSSKCPGSLILQAYDLSLALQKAGMPIAGGFHSPVEKDMLKVALRGEQPTLVCPARGLEGMRIPVEYRQPIQNGRLLLASIFTATVRRPTAETAYLRNRFVAALAEKILVIHADPGGKLTALCQEIFSWGKPLYTLESTHNRFLIENGAQVYRYPEE